MVKVRKLFHLMLLISTFELLSKICQRFDEGNKEYNLKLWCNWMHVPFTCSSANQTWETCLWNFFHFIYRTLRKDNFKRWEGGLVKNHFPLFESLISWWINAYVLKKGNGCFRALKMEIGNWNVEALFWRQSIVSVAMVVLILIQLIRISLVCQMLI